ncbi:lipoprotein-releasing ABC transporter ATP-binding protein LolD [Balneatrix alpica]|uniref:lipoprotein-releasing ABC transporter ATP-binding protein LolD n=1 Tax=Balneatrix alpica TaxID=75684 RepID=UPI002738D804|nr:lipoprotein-releasing ABC transporter ATP-binding protein LolD [Balneatrix alpica]
MNKPLVLAAQQLSKSYREGDRTLHILQNINLAIHAGDSLAIVGSSGSGKSTLLNMLGGLDLCDEGKVLLQGQDLAELSEAKRGRWRNQHLGFVYQFHHLLAEFTALENVMIPLRIRGLSAAQAAPKAQALLERVGLAQRVQHKPGELSGGERQRVAIARALVTEPACVLMDEPTGNLDHQTALDVQALMLELNQQLQTALVVVTHDLELAGRMQRQVRLHEGQLSPL